MRVLIAAASVLAAHAFGLGSPSLRYVASGARFRAPTPVLLQNARASRPCTAGTVRSGVSNAQNRAAKAALLASVRSSVATSPRANVFRTPPRFAASPATTMIMAPPSPSAGGMFTATNVDSRRVKPTEAQMEGKSLMKVVYIVLESQYQASLTKAVNAINDGPGDLAVEMVGYVLEELRDDAAFETFKEDVNSANVFIGSLIFVQELAEKVVEAVEPARDNLDAALIFPSMPEVMRLNKVGKFTMESLGQKKSIISDFIKAGKAQDGSGFEEGLLKLVRTLPKVLKYLPTEKAADARAFVESFQYWLGGSPDNLEAMLRNLGDLYVEGVENAVATAPISEPIVIADVGIWHPMAPTAQGSVFDQVDSYLDWYNANQAPAAGIDPATASTVGIVVQKSHINTKDECHYVALISELESRGARVITIYSGGLDFSGPVGDYFIDRNGKTVVDSVINLTGFALVGGPAAQDHPKAIRALNRLDVPYLCAVPLVFQSFEEWQASELGLHPIQVALQVSLPELDGAIEPIIFAGREGATGRSVPLADRVNLLADRALKWSALRKKKNADKKLAITIFSFPPDKGNVGTAAYLDVFGSIKAVLDQLTKDGYDLGDNVPGNIEGLIDSVLNDADAKFDSPNLNVEYAMPVEEYERLTPYSEDLEENWGPAPGNLNSDGQNLLIFGKRFGNVFIGVQPTFGYEGDPMRLLFAKSASPHHGFAAYYTYLEKIFGADAVLHFGTHGSLEFMPGKQVGMSGQCYPDRLINSIPNLYFYAANNPSEATIAKRRSYAATISYLTPPAENAGLYKGLKELSDLIKSYQELRDNEARGGPIVSSIIATSWTCNLDKDIPDLPSLETDAKTLSKEVRDDVVGKVYRRLMEIESRLLPCGLHTIGVPPTAEEAIATLVNIAEINRPEAEVPLLGLPNILARSIGREIEEIYRSSDAGDLDDVELLNSITAGTRAAVRACVDRSTDADGRVQTVSTMFDGMSDFFSGGTPWKIALKEAGFPDAPEAEMKPLFEFLEVCLTKIVADNELGAMMGALNGDYITPGPGGDPIRNPDVLPTGKNMHALDPQSIPTSAAVDCANAVVERLLERLAADAEDGKLPESIAFTLWGTDNIKTYGESLAQVLSLVGIRPVPDSIGRVNKLEVIPLEELGRPRIDVVVSCSGVFRDLFINQMNLLDRAVKLAAEQDEPDEMNFVRKHAREQAAEMGVTLREAATRVFSNAAGSYSANVGLAIENGGWESEEQLQNQFLERKGFAFNADKPGMMEAQQMLFKSALSKVDVTFQNLDSSEISISDVSHYYDSDPTKVVAGLRTDKKKPTSFMADTTTANAQVRTLSETVRLDSRTKLLNPKFYEGMLNSGYEGAREIQKRLRNTMGWSATSGDVDNFVYEDANEIFIADDAMRERLMAANPNALRDMVTTFLEANGRGYWDTDDENIERLQEIYQEVEDKLEGV